jgi:hypothetical protein
MKNNGLGQCRYHLQCHGSGRSFQRSRYVW